MIFSKFVRLCINRAISYFQLIASAALYLAGKLKDDPVKIRDVINVTHITMHRGKRTLRGRAHWDGKYNLFFIY